MMMKSPGQKRSTTMPDPVNLSAGIIGFSLLMYVLLDGTDLGVGMLFAWFIDADDRRRLASSILPVWDANETWLVLAGGAMLALFPAAYSQILSGLYLPLFAMLLALILRAVALEYRDQASPRAQRRLDTLFICSSALTAFLQGMLAGSIFGGVAPGGTFSFFTLFTVLCGAAAMTGYLLMGCCWVRWRLQGETGRQASLLASLFLVATLILILSLCLLMPGRFLAAWSLLAGKLLLLTGLALGVAIPCFLHGSRLLMPLMAVLLLMTCLMLLAMMALYPWLIPETLSLKEAASGPVTQQFVLTGLAIIIPMTVAYNSWAFWVLKGKVK
ncbi:cytochrome d ubiquinol oxidase subunit II [Erwinia sp. E_sp_B01_9]|uniref:cytochrome d ubiquinol oxidase subunit II n=2 Tax=Erwinia TaxID=551 RepID=UPI003D9AFA2F